MWAPANGATPFLCGSGLLVSLLWADSIEPARYCQVNSCGKETPGSIPNPAVKLPAADGSMVITPCESRYRLAFLFVRPHRITASPSDSQSESRGSIPRGATKKHTRKGVFFYCWGNM